MRNHRMSRAAMSAALVAASLTAATAIAQTPQPVQTQAVQKTWSPGEIHPDHTFIYVHVFKTGMGHEHGVVGRVKEGVLHLGATQNAGRVVADLTSFVADTDAGRKFFRLPGQTDPETQKKVNANMLGPDVLNVAKFPTATATIISARLLDKPSAEGLPQYLLEGELTLSGVTRRVSVVAEAAEQNGWVRLRGHIALKQSEFGMQPYTAMLGAVGVGDQLELYGEAYLVKEANFPAVAVPAGAPPR